MSKLSIIVPVYWNEDTLSLLYEDLRKNILKKIGDYEIVFVDDGSADASWSVMNQIGAADARVRCVKLSRNFGEHAAILAGLSVCTGDCAVTKQADLQEDSEIILQMYESWKKGNKVVLALRKERDDPFLVRFSAGLYYKLMKKWVNKNMPEGGCDCYLLDRQVICTLLQMDEKHSSLTLQVLWAGFQTDHIYFHRRERKVGKGRWTFAKKFKLALDSMVSFSYVPIRIMWVTGIVFCMCAVILGIDIVAEWMTVGTPAAGWPSLMCVVLCSFGLILLMLGLLGEYIWRTLDAARNRPPFIIDEVRSCGLEEGNMEE